MDLKEATNIVGDKFLALRIRLAIRGGLEINKSARSGAVESRAIDMFTQDRAVLAVLDMEERSARNAAESIEDPDLEAKIDEAKNSLSLAQLGALIRVDGDRSEQQLKRFGL